MYLSFFSLSTKPFELLPNPDFLFLSEAHKKALVFLEYGLLEHTGFILFTGEVGTGKTTIIRRLLDKIPADMTLAKIFNTQVSSVQLLRMINDDFGIGGSSSDKAYLLRDLNEFLIDQYAAGRRSILIIDEAQNLGPEQLEEIRLLSNLETSHAKLLQIILVGQPELRDKLGSQSLIQLRQRILVHCHLSPLNREEIETYIFHRLEKAGNRNALMWEENAMQALHKATRGIPRLINILCHYILLDAFSQGTRTVTRASLTSILEHLDFETQFWPEQHAEGKPAETTSLSAASDGAARVEASLKQISLIADRMQECIGMLHNTLVSLSKLIVIAAHASQTAASDPRHAALRPQKRRINRVPVRKRFFRT